MYAIVYTKANVSSLNECIGIPKIKVYYCKKKKLAAEYLDIRFNRLNSMMLNKSKANPNMIEFTNSGCKGDKTWACVEYVDKNLLTEPCYHHTIEEFSIVRAQEILDLASGPSLKVE